MNDISLESNSEAPMVEKSVAIKKGNVFLIYIAAGVAMVILILVGVTLFRGSSTEPEDVVTKDEKSKILTEIALNNPKGLIKIEDKQISTNDMQNQYSGDIYSQPNPNPLVPTPTIQGGRVIMPSKLEIAAPDLSVYNYVYTKSVHQSGPKIDSCNLGGYGGYYFDYFDSTDSTTEYYSYFDNDRSYYKSVISTSPENIEFVTISKYGKDIGEYYKYRGGSLAIKEKYEPYENFSNSYMMTPTSYPQSYPASYPNSDVLNLFGPNAKISKEYEKNGKKYYEVSTRLQYGCHFYEDDQYKYRPAYYIYQVNGSTSEIEETSYYIDNVNESNLVWKTNVTTTRSKSSLDSVSSVFETNACNFSNSVSENLACTKELKICNDGQAVARNSAHSCEFDFCPLQYQSISSNICGNNQEIRLLTKDYSDYTYSSNNEVNANINYLTKQDIVIPLADTYGLNYISGVDFPKNIYNFDYIYRKDYYPNSAKGQKDYENRINSIYYNSLLNYSASKGENYYRMYVFDKAKFDQNNVENIMRKDLIGKVYETSSNVIVNNQEVDSKVFFTKTNYSFPTSYPGSYPNSYPTSYPTSYPIENVDLNSYYDFREVFEYGDFVYLVVQGDYSPSGYINNFKTYRTSIPSEMNTVSNFIYRY